AVLHLHAEADVERLLAGAADPEDRLARFRHFDRALFQSPGANHLAEDRQGQFDGDDVAAAAKYERRAADGAHIAPPRPVRNFGGVLGSVVHRRTLERQWGKRANAGTLALYVG